MATATPATDAASIGQENRIWLERIVRDADLDAISEGRGLTQAAAGHVVNVAIAERFPSGRGGVGIAMGRHAAALRALYRQMCSEPREYDYREPVGADLY